MLRRFGTRRRFFLDGTLSEVESHRADASGECSVSVDERPHRVRLLCSGPKMGLVLVDGRVLRLALHGRSRSVFALRSGVGRQVEIDAAVPASNATGALSRGTSELTAPMPGRVLAVQVTLGQAVERGAPLVLIEAMKMQNQLVAASPGVVSRVLVEPGMAVERGALLVRIG